MKDYEGLIWFLSIITWIALFFIIKYYSERWMCVYIGCAFIFIGLVFAIGGFSATK